jgi:hypothetical protein
MSTHQERPASFSTDTPVARMSQRERVLASLIVRPQIPGERVRHGRSGMAHVR